MKGDYFCGVVESLNSNSLNRNSSLDFVTLKSYEYWLRMLRIVKSYPDPDDSIAIFSKERASLVLKNISDHFEMLNALEDKLPESEREQYIEQEKREQLENIISEEQLKPDETRAFMQRAFMEGYVAEKGTGIARILPPTNPFLPESGQKKQTVIDRLKAYLQRFLGTSDSVTLSIPKPKKNKKAEEIRLVPQGSMLEDVEEDDEVRRLVHNMMALDEGTTIMQIVVECQKQFQERYFSMKGNEWRHLLRDYVRKVTEQPQLQEQEVFTFKLAV